jgi:hypothetical protein
MEEAQKLTALQGFEAMRRFVQQFSQREPAEHRERFEQLLRWTEIEPDGITVDPAQWADWQAAVDETLSAESEATGESA